MTLDAHVHTFHIERRRSNRSLLFDLVAHPTVAARANADLREAA